MGARERFEKWARGHYCSLKPESWNVDYYGDAATAAAYAAWLAAKADDAEVTRGAIQEAFGECFDDPRPLEKFDAALAIRATIDGGRE